MYGHPFEPYEVQRQFMQSLYEELSQHGVALFESPTGTGKTLSLLCPALAWLRDASKRQLESDLAQIEAEGGPSWMRAQAKSLRQAQFDEESRMQKALLEQVQNMTQVKELTSQPKRPKFDDVKYATQPEADDDELEPLRPANRIIFASRTHSQLAQVASALRSVRIQPPPRYIQLGSRQQLCIHPDVRKLRSVQQMNDKCADLQQSNQCQFRHNTSGLQRRALAEIMDIEELAKAGRAQSACAYYAARDAAPYAEVVALPYALLLVSRSREAMSLDINKAVVIIDEAHNLIDTLSALHSQTLSRDNLRNALTGLRIYIERVGARLLPANRRSVLQILLLVESLDEAFANLPKDARPGTPVDGSKLLAAKNADTLDVPALANFMQESKLMFKVDSYVRINGNGSADSSADGAGLTGNVNVGSSGSLSTIMDFVLTAIDPLAEGKLFIDSENGNQVLRYLILDTSSSFKEVVDQASAVVLAGGTMEPTEEFRNRLFPYIDKLSVHSYGHIVPRSQLLVLPVSGMKFTFADRGAKSTVSKLGNTLLEIIHEVPNGVVAFFPGYAYLEQVVAQWRHSGIFGELNKIKKVFVETRSSSGDLFTKYGTAALSSTGGVLLAVVGGRLSEGINFSDKLARAVAMVGVPFPNAFSAEMVAKRTHIEKSALARGLAAPLAKEEAKQYYENIAMRAVNQSVGRAIRHINDYAALFLIDDRFSTPHIQHKLSKWVRESIEECRDLREQTSEFFKRNCK